MKSNLGRYVTSKDYWFSRVFFGGDLLDLWVGLRVGYDGKIEGGIWLYK